MTRGPEKKRSALPQRVGLARALSKLGYCSRSAASELVRAGRVRLNGAAPRDPETPVHLGRDRVEVDGRAAAESERVYLMLNKPRGLVTTASDEKGRATVYSCLPEGLPWVAPVGRLDRASEGLLLVTNDSAWAARIAAPDTHLAKTYHVQVRGVADAAAAEALVAALARGVRDQGEWLRVRSARSLRGGERNAWLEIVLEEGKNRHIRRMLERLGRRVLRLVRVSIGPVTLGDLAKGACRTLTAGEKRALDRGMRATTAASRPE
jgi:23S rRNA pseudouridine2605 synthase